MDYGSAMVESVSLTSLSGGIDWSFVSNTWKLFSKSAGRLDNFFHLKWKGPKSKHVCFFSIKWKDISIKWKDRTARACALRMTGVLIRARGSDHSSRSSRHYRSRHQWSVTTLCVWLFVLTFAITIIIRQQCRTRNSMELIMINEENAFPDCRDYFV